VSLSPCCLEAAACQCRTLARAFLSPCCLEALPRVCGPVRAHTTDDGRATRTVGGSVRVRGAAARSAEDGVRRHELRHTTALGRCGRAGASAREIPVVHASAARPRAAGAMESTGGTAGVACSAGRCLAHQTTLKRGWHHESLPDKRRRALDSREQHLRQQLVGCPSLCRWARGERHAGRGNASAAICRVVTAAAAILALGRGRSDGGKPHALVVDQERRIKARLTRRTHNACVHEPDAAQLIWLSRKTRPPISRR